MRLSLNEIAAALRKAGLGAGLPVGLADEVSDAAIWLVQRDLDGVEAALRALTPPFSDTLQVDPLTLRGSVAVAGPSAVDLLMTALVGAGVRIEAVDAPLLLAGIVGRALESAGPDDERVAVLRFSGGAEIVVSGDAVRGDFPTPSEPVEIRLEASTSATVRTGQAPPAAVIVDDDLWAEVQALAARTYVPADAASRSRGAGAGAIDNE